MSKKIMACALLFMLIASTVGLGLASLVKANPAPRWQNKTPQTDPPSIVINTPGANATIFQNSLNLTFTITKPNDWQNSLISGTDVISEIDALLDGNETALYKPDNPYPWSDDFQRVSSHNWLFTNLTEGSHVVLVNVTAIHLYYGYTSYPDASMGGILADVLTQNVTSAVSFTVDSVPANITSVSVDNQTFSSSTVPLNLTVSKPYTWLNFSIDGQGNQTFLQNTTLSGLTEGSHNITIYATDTYGLVSKSETYNFSVDTTPPKVSQLSIENKTYGTSSIPLSILTNETTSWIAYSLDGVANATVNGNFTLNRLSDGTHSIVVYVNDTLGNTGKSGIAYFTIDTTPPAISNLSVENKTYSSKDRPLSFDVNETASWTAYSLDNQANVTINGNTTLAALSEGTHNIVLYANDSVGNMGKSDNVFFTVNTQPSLPIILIIVAVVIVAVAAPLVYIKKRKRRV